MKNTHIKTLCVGLAMGTADIIPGVSGGTIAFITGIYDTLITSMSRIDMQLRGHIRSLQRKKAFIYINGSFLLTLFSGIILAIILVSQTMHHLLETYPVDVYAFFFGLVVASIVLIAKKTAGLKTPSSIGAMLAGILLGYILTATIHIQASHSLLFMFLSGMIASSAMILPGISGSYILVIMGMYEYILGLVDTQLEDIKTFFTHFDPAVLITSTTGSIGIFTLGVISGLLIFSKLLHRLLKTYRATIMALLLGIMIGALHTLRVWKTAMSSSGLLTTISLSIVGAVLIGAIGYMHKKNT